MKRHYANRDVLFISDVRSTINVMEDHVKEARKNLDMERQQVWHLIINPIASMLKFRLPYPPAPP